MTFTRTDPELLKKLQNILTAAAILIHNEHAEAKTDKRSKVVARYKLAAKGAAGISDIKWGYAHKDPEKPSTKTTQYDRELDKYPNCTLVGHTLSVLRDNHPKVSSKVGDLLGESIATPDEAALDYAYTILERELGISRGFDEYEVIIEAKAVVRASLYIPANSPEEALQKAREEQGAEFNIVKDSIQILDVRISTEDDTEDQLL